MSQPTPETILEREDQAREAWADAHLANMNAMAESILQNGPVYDMTHFLFAMHGVDVRYQNAPDAATTYTDLERRFNSRTLGMLFAMPEDLDDIGRQPYTYRIMARAVFSEYVERRQSERRRSVPQEFSAIRYEIEKDEIGPSPEYIGKLVVPSFELPAGSGQEAVRPADLIVHSVSRKVRKSVVNSPADGSLAEVEPGEILFGNDLAAYAHADGPELYSAAVLELVQARQQLHTGIARLSRAGQQNLTQQLAKG